MTTPDRQTIIHWLTAQRQMLALWIDDIDNENATHVDDDLDSRLREHERWLDRSIEELMSIC